ncbi:MAG: hypothetical protein EOO03_08570 [Chitinophagaceae bacterium]|nr:MAG: hypothetical protein EOO03_08570 [Chitinophagaceae bacterium]
MGNYEVSFTNADSLTQVAEYNDAGVMLKSKTTYNLEALPEVVTAAVEKKYPAAKITEVVKVAIPGVAPYFKVKAETAASLKRELYISEEGAVVE